MGLTRYLNFKDNSRFSSASPGRDLKKANSSAYAPTSTGATIAARVRASSTLRQGVEVVRKGQYVRPRPKPGEA